MPCGSVLHLEILHGCGYRAPVGIHHVGLQAESAVLARSIAHIGGYPHDGRLSVMLRQIGRGDEGAVPVNIGRFFHDQAHVAVNSSAEHMFPGTRRAVGAPQVVHPNGYHIAALLCPRSNVDGESGVSSIVPPGLFTIHKHFGFAEHAVELQEEFLLQQPFGQIQLLPVPSVANIEILAHEIRNAERMGHTDGFPCGIVERALLRAGKISRGILPRIIQVPNFTGPIPRPNGERAQPQPYGARPSRNMSHL